MKKLNISIGDTENYFSMQKVTKSNIKTRFNNDLLIPRFKKQRHLTQLKQDGALEFVIRQGYPHHVDTQRR